MTFVFTEDVVITSRFTPILEGKQLLAAMTGLARTVLVSDSEFDEITRWTKLNDIQFDDMKLGELRSTITQLRSQRKIDILFTPQPSLAAWAIGEGITTVLFCHPTFALPRHLPRSKSWLELIKELDLKVGIEIEDKNDYEDDE